MFKFSTVQLPTEIIPRVTKVKISGSDDWYTVDFVAETGCHLRVLEIFGHFESHAITSYSFDGRV